jgi:aromatic ring-opening dioxygenase LigB subunit
MKTIKIKIDKEVIRKADKTARRKVLVEAGVYNRPTHKVHKGVKDYTRKVKHKKNFIED